FVNFDKSEDSRMFSLREGLQHSVNLVYIRLMRDLVQFHLARLPYDPHSVLVDPENPQRKKMLDEIAEQESRRVLSDAYSRLHNLPSEAIVERIAGKSTTPRRLAMFFVSWSSDV